MSGHSDAPSSSLAVEQGVANIDPPAAANAGSSEAEIALALVEALSDEGKAELIRALHLCLYPAPSARERHEAELRPLAGLLHANEGGVSTDLEGKSDGVRAPDETQLRILREKSGAADPRSPLPTITREFYDANAPEDALSSQALLKRHNTRNWSLVCKAAASLPDEDGNRLAQGAHWAHPTRGREGPRAKDPYTETDAIDAVLKCASDLRTPPSALSAQRYIEWSSTKRRKARTNGLPDSRLPTYETMRRRLFPSGWAQLQQAAQRALKIEDRS